MQREQTPTVLLSRFFEVTITAWEEPQMGIHRLFPSARQEPCTTAPADGTTSGSGCLPLGQLDTRDIQGLYGNGHIPLGQSAVLARLACVLPRAKPLDKLFLPLPVLIWALSEVLPQWLRQDSGAGA